jgi:hypothetical protein
LPCTTICCSKLLGTLLGRSIHKSLCYRCQEVADRDEDNRGADGGGDDNRGADGSGEDSGGADDRGADDGGADNSAYRPAK